MSGETLVIVRNEAAAAKLRRLVTPGTYVVGWGGMLGARRYDHILVLTDLSDAAEGSQTLASRYSDWWHCDVRTGLTPEGTISS